LSKICPVVKSMMKKYTVTVPGVKETEVDGPKSFRLAAMTSLSQMCSILKVTPPSYEVIADNERLFEHGIKTQVSCQLQDHITYGFANQVEAAKCNAAAKMLDQLKDIISNSCESAITNEHCATCSCPPSRTTRRTFGQYRLEGASQPLEKHFPFSNIFLRCFGSSNLHELHRSELAPILSSDEVEECGPMLLDLLSDIAYEQHFKVNYANISDREPDDGLATPRYQCLAQLSTLPSVVLAHGVGDSFFSAKVNACRSALAYLKMIVRSRVKIMNAIGVGAARRAGYAGFVFGPERSFRRNDERRAYGGESDSSRSATRTRNRSYGVRFYQPNAGGVKTICVCDRSNTEGDSEHGNRSLVSRSDVAVEEAGVGIEGASVAVEGATVGIEGAGVGRGSVAVERATVGIEGAGVASVGRRRGRGRRRSGLRIEVSSEGHILRSGWNRRDNSKEDRRARDHKAKDPAAANVSSESSINIV